MNNLRSLVAVCVLGLALTACAESPAPLAPEGARFDGYTYGSGNRSDSTSTATTSDSTITASGGFTYGSDS